MTGFFLTSSKHQPKDWLMKDYSEKQQNEWCNNKRHFKTENS
jgi:hypothetical protein